MREHVGLVEVEAVDHVGVGQRLEGFEALDHAAAGAGHDQRQAGRGAAGGRHDVALQPRPLRVPARARWLVHRLEGGPSRVEMRGERPDEREIALPGRGAGRAVEHGRDPALCSLRMQVEDDPQTRVETGLDRCQDLVHELASPGAAEGEERPGVDRKADEVEAELTQSGEIAPRRDRPIRIIGRPLEFAARRRRLPGLREPGPDRNAPGEFERPGGRGSGLGRPRAVPPGRAEPDPAEPGAGERGAEERAGRAPTWPRPGHRRCSRPVRPGPGGDGRRAPQVRVRSFPGSHPSRNRPPRAGGPPARRASPRDHRS